MDLSKKSNDELKKLLDKYEIIHGPVVETTRKQYEKQLQEATGIFPEKYISDKTYYREEEEDVTCITYRGPVRNEGVETEKQRGNTDPDADKELDQETKPTIQFTSRTKNHSLQQFRLKWGSDRKSGHSLRKVTWLLLLMLLLAAIFYYAYSCLW